MFILVCKNTQARQGDLRVARRGRAARRASRRPTSRSCATRTARSARSGSTRRWCRRPTPRARRATSRAGCGSRSTRSASCDWPRDPQGRPVYPRVRGAGDASSDRPLHPPGRDVRCIVSVGMLTEGWDCNTVTHIVGLRPFMSQLLCEQVVGRGLRRATTRSARTASSPRRSPRSSASRSR